MSAAAAAEIRAGLDHPVIDADGHLIEIPALFVDALREVAGPSVERRWHRLTSGEPLDPDAAPTPPRQQWPACAPWYSIPPDAYDRAAGCVPGILHGRLDELGIDLSILYPSLGLVLIGLPDDELRQACCRALNTYIAGVLDGYGDRLLAPATIPMVTPDEAIAELDHAVEVLGYRTIMISSWVERRLADGGTRPDVLALDSAYDYDPFWRRCAEHRVAVTAHSGTMGNGLRRSPTRYMYNHIGNFAAAGEGLAKALVFGGVLARFADLRFAFLEGGVGWGVGLLADLVGRWSKRGGDNIDLLDPRHTDWAVVDAALDAHGDPRFTAAAVKQSIRSTGGLAPPPAERDDFVLCGVSSAAELAEQFSRAFFFGCEADDPINAIAFDERLVPFGRPVRAVLGSDLAHWDVLDMRHVMPEAWELVERDLLTPDQFRDFSCDNAIRLHAHANPAFFAGTVVESYVGDFLATA